jgi:hypothetical protein
LIPGIYELLDYTINTVNSLGLQIIWSYQNAPRVNKPYILIDYTENDLPNFECADPYIDANGIQVIGSWRRATVSLQFYCGPNSDRLASQVALMLGGSSSVDKQTQLDVAIGNRLMLQRMPALLNNSQYEDRAIYQFDFYYTDRYNDNVGLIEVVEVTGGYSGSVLNPPDTDPPENIEDIRTWPLHSETIIYLHPADIKTVWDDNDTLWDDSLTEWDVHSGKGRV